MLKAPGSNSRFKNFTSEQRTLLFQFSAPEKTITNKVKAGGPSYEEQLSALALGEDWLVLNTHLLALDILASDSGLSDQTNAFKHALQTHGPRSSALKDLRQNKGAAVGSVYHGHVSGRGGIYVLEWAIMDEDARTMALVGFAHHENYAFVQKPLNDKEKEKIYNHPKNQALMARSDKKRAEAQDKVNALCKQHTKQLTI